MADKKSWEKKELFALISRWELSPELWDAKAKDYRNRHKKQNTLNNLAREFNTTDREITRKLHNLRTQFNQELRKMCANEYYESSWEFFRVMTFIRPNCLDAKMVDDLESEATREPESVDAGEGSWSNEETEQTSVASALPEKRKLNISEQTKTAAPLPWFNEAREETIVPKKRIKSDQTNVADLLEKAIKVIVHKRTDEFQVFGDFVACEIRNLRSQERQRKLKRVIQRAILDALEEDALDTSVDPLYDGSQPHSSGSFNLNMSQQVPQTQGYNIQGISCKLELETNTSEGGSTP